MYVYLVVAPEFTIWRESAVLYVLSHRMDELIVEGPDAAPFLDRIGINRFANFDLNVAKHFVPVTPNGHVIGDMIIFREREDKFVLMGRAPLCIGREGQIGRFVRSLRLALVAAMGTNLPT